MNATGEKNVGIDATFESTRKFCSDQVHLIIRAFIFEF